MLFFLTGNITASFTYNITFSGSGATLGDVIVKNLTKGTTAIVTAGNTLCLTDQTNAFDQLNADNESVSIYPNPIQSTAILTFTATNEGSSHINAYALDGKKVMGFTTNLRMGKNSFQLSLPAGVYMLQMLGNGYQYTSKAISQAIATCQPQICFAGVVSETKPQKTKILTNGTTTMTYSTGDQLLYNATSGIYSVVMNDSPTSDKSVNFQFTTNTFSIATASIPAGTFMMGSPTNEISRYNNETQHSVTLSAFRMSKYEITNEQYAAFLNAKSVGSDGKYATFAYPTKALIYSNSSCGLTFIGSQWVPVAGFENNPVINVTWHGATEFATYAGGRLPTEAEWEYTCRAGTTTPFNTGNFLTNLQANYDWAAPYNNVTNTVTTNPGTTQVVGSYATNAWGLCDMHGSVWEWCADWYGTYPTTVQTNPTGGATGSARVIRGGSWNDYAQDCRSAFRDCNRPYFSNDYVGFRVVLP